jgi:hypothetical protein
MADMRKPGQSVWKRRERKWCCRPTIFNAQEVGHPVSLELIFVSDRTCDNKVPLLVVSYLYAPQSCSLLSFCSSRLC